MTVGEKIVMNETGLHTPDFPIIPFIEGDGIGPEIWQASKKYLKQQLKKPTVIPVKSSGKKCLQEGRLLI